MVSQLVIQEVLSQDAKYYQAIHCGKRQILVSFRVYSSFGIKYII